MTSELECCDLPRGGGGPCLECSAWLGREQTIEDALGFLVRDPRASGPFSHDGDTVAVVLEMQQPDVRRVRVDAHVFRHDTEEPELQAWLHPSAVMASLGLGDWWTSDDPMAWDDDTRPQQQMAPLYRLLGSWWMGACQAAGWTGASLLYEDWSRVDLRKQNPRALVTHSMIANAAGWITKPIKDSFAVVEPRQFDDSKIE